MEISHRTVVFEDERGRITDIVEAIDFNSATIITSCKGVTRGNHCHNLTTQWVYVLSGKMLAHSRMPGEDIRRAVLEQGAILKNVPGEHHALTALEDSEFLVLTSGLRGGNDYERDTYRLEQPMQDQEGVLVNS